MKSIYVKGPSKHLEKKAKVDLIFKSLLSLSVEDERIVVYDPIQASFVHFFALFEISFLHW